MNQSSFIKNKHSNVSAPLFQLISILTASLRLRQTSCTRSILSHSLPHQVALHQPPHQRIQSSNPFLFQNDAFPSHQCRRGQPRRYRRCPSHHLVARQSAEPRHKVQHGCRRRAHLRCFHINVSKCSRDYYPSVQLVLGNMLVVARQAPSLRLSPHLRTARLWLPQHQGAEALHRGDEGEHRLELPDECVRLLCPVLFSQHYHFVHNFGDNSTNRKAANERLPSVLDIGLDDVIVGQDIPGVRRGV